MQNGGTHAAPTTASSSSPNSDVRSSKRCHAGTLCALGVFVAIGSALGVAGLADMAASPKGRIMARRLIGQWSQEEDSSPVRNLMSTCTFDNQWVSTQWSTLSKQEQNAWVMLGWVKAVWDASWGAAIPGVTTSTTTPPATTTLFGQVPTTVTTTSFVPMTEQTCYEDLHENERDAAISLGYTIMRWGECKKKGCPWPTGIPAISATCLAKMIYLESKFNETQPWANITQMKRDNLVLLGYDPDGNSWKAGRKPPSYGRPWAELTVREREAALFLGFTAQTWEKCEKDMDSPCLKRLEHIEVKMRTWVWEQQLYGTRERLSDLGWQSRTWFEGETPAVMKQPWMGLTSMQRSSARILGYSQDTFRGCPDATCLDRFAYVQRRWKGIGWMEMKLSERRGWMLLGHSEALWRTGNLPGTMQKRWQELSPEQQLEATVLGHSEGTWQGCNTDWVGRNTTDDNSTMVDPSGAVRARMFIDRPYSEISGNVYGKQVATMPTSFIRVFENAVARALFCGNPPLSLNPATYIDSDGEPVCVQKTNYEKQKYRIRVLNVVEGSIVVDFFFVANSTAQQTTSRMLFESLVRQIDSKLTSPICHDKYFGRFAKAAIVEENKLSSLKWNEMQTALNFEAKRNAYTDANKCLLHTDGKLGRTTCGTSMAMGRPTHLHSLSFAGPVLVLLALALTLVA